MVLHRVSATFPMSWTCRARGLLTEALPVYQRLFRITRSNARGSLQVSLLVKARTLVVVSTIHKPLHRRDKDDDGKCNYGVVHVGGGDG